MAIGARNLITLFPSGRRGGVHGGLYVLYIMLIAVAYPVDFLLSFEKFNATNLIKEKMNNNSR
jgi:hypothetical protein